MLNENGDKPEFIVNLENEIHKKAEKYGNRTVYVVNKEDKREFYYIIVNGENKEIEGYTKKYYNDEHDYDITNAHYKDGEITDYWRIFEKPDPKNPGIFIEYRDRYIKDSDGKWEHTTTQRRFKDSGFHVTWLD